MIYIRLVWKYHITLPLKFKQKKNVALHNFLLISFSKAMSLSEPGTTGKTSGLGIVCKKEDLKAILCSATSKKFPLASPKKRNRLRQTKSASFEPSDETSKKEPVRRAGSEEARTRRFESNESKSVDIETVVEPQQVYTDI